MSNFNPFQNNSNNSQAPLVDPFGYGNQGRPQQQQKPQIPLNSQPPPKYIKVNGITKLNPAYTQYQGQTGQQTTTLNPTLQQTALPVLSTMEDYMSYNEAAVNSGMPERPLAQQTDVSIEKMQSQEHAQKIGLPADQAVDALQNVLAKYEVPIGLMNKLMDLQNYDILEFIIDDSGSMGMNTDSYHPNGQPMTRWQEAISRLKSMVEVIAYVPTKEIKIRFLNRPDILSGSHNGQPPHEFIGAVCQQIDECTRRIPQGTTPAFKALNDSFQQGRGKRVSRYFFGDGEPNSGEKPKIEQLVRYRQDPQFNPVTFLSCTNEDSEVEWMKELEEVAPYCAEFDDYNDERDEVLKDQGNALPFTRGFHLVGQLVAAMNPTDLDAMDESVPLTKYALDNLLGVDHAQQEYRHYFDHFLRAQRSRPIEGNVDKIKQGMNWDVHYRLFLEHPQSTTIPAVQQFKQQLTSAGGGAPPSGYQPPSQPYPGSAPGQSYGGQYAPPSQPYPASSPGQSYLPPSQPYPASAPGQSYQPPSQPYPASTPGQSYGGQYAPPGQSYPPPSQPFPGSAPGQSYRPPSQPYPASAPGQSHPGSSPYPPPYNQQQPPYPGRK